LNFLLNRTHHPLAALVGGGVAAVMQDAPAPATEEEKIKKEKKKGKGRPKGSMIP
jgi:hypothetical protein